MLQSSNSNSVGHAVPLFIGDWTTSRLRVRVPPLHSALQSLQASHSPTSQSRTEKNDINDIMKTTLIRDQSYD